MNRLQKKDENDQVIKHALKILEKRMYYRVIDPHIKFNSPEVVRNFLTLKLAEREHEIFAVLFLNNRHQIIAYEEMFRGTLDGASVHPREVLKTALLHNAAAVILVHNHPSGLPTISRADRAVTQRIKEALALIEIRVLDHFIVAGTTITSFAEQGEL